MAIVHTCLPKYSGGEVCLMTLIIWSKFGGILRIEN